VIIPQKNIEQIHCFDDEFGFAPIAILCISTNEMSAHNGFQSKIAIGIPMKMYNETAIKRFEMGNIRSTKKSQNQVETRRSTYTQTFFVLFAT
jgi:hypothetical protein